MFAEVEEIPARVRARIGVDVALGEEEASGHRAGWFGVALHAAPSEVGDELQRSSQTGAGHSFAAVSLADEAACDPPIRELFQSLVVFTPTLDAGHLGGLPELAPPDAFVAVEDKRRMSGAGAHSVEFSLPLWLQSIGIVVVFRVEAHAPATSEDPVVGLHQRCERFPTRRVERLDRVLVHHEPRL